MFSFGFFCEIPTINEGGVGVCVTEFPVGPPRVLGGVE